MTTSALEKRTGLPRTTIYFYIRQGLLPEPQRTATGRSLFAEHHVDLLWKIGELKHRGYSLIEIKQALDTELEQARDSDVDLAVLENERMRAAIIEAASEEFEASGYRGTHVMAIIQKMGINPHIFYSHFPSKLDLLIECWKSATPLPITPIAVGETTPHDFGENVLRGLVGDSRWHQLGACLTGAVRAEAPQDPETMRKLAEAWDAILVNPLRDFAAVRKPGSSLAPVSEELLAYSLIGAHRNARLRASWDDKFDVADLLRAHLFMFFALMAAIAGEIDVASQVAAYESQIQELTAGMDDLPPAL